MKVFQREKCGTKLGLGQISETRYLHLADHIAGYKTWQAYNSDDVFLDKVCVVLPDVLLVQLSCLCSSFTVIIEIDVHRCSESGQKLLKTNKCRDIIFEAGRLWPFSAFRMGAYSRWALIRGWVLIRINAVVGSAELRNREHENKTGGNWGSIHSFFLFPTPPTFRVPFTFTFASSTLPESLQQATLPTEKLLDTVFLVWGLKRVQKWRLYWTRSICHESVRRWQALITTK